LGLNYFNKLKLSQYNDPIYGFITIPTPFIAQLVNHPYVQRLRRIKQMGLSFLVFPSTEHTRFQHALGAMHLANRAVSNLRKQSVPISDDEAESLYACMLLHDVGHGPFSHALESVFFPNSTHEDMSVAIMNTLNDEFDGKLSLAIKMFTNTYSRAFFYELIASHIDLDRLDYLKRDSFYSGVTEGNINSERLITMMRVQDNRLVFHKKAVYSIEKFLLARRMMYWSLYLHKTSFVAEEVLLKFFDRATILVSQGKKVKASDALFYFLQHPKESIEEKRKRFILLDDVDVWMCLKAAMANSDRVLSTLATMLLERKLPKISLSDNAIDDSVINQKRAAFVTQTGMPEADAVYFVFSGSLYNQGYRHKENPIQLLDDLGNCTLFDSSPDVANIPRLTKRDTKFFFAYPKEV
jgi:HD superfamily phosphohydrolase